MCLDQFDYPLPSRMQIDRIHLLAHLLSSIVIFRQSGKG
jgi:hypothetical protein